jgi:hypothetical protein
VVLFTRAGNAWCARRAPAPMRPGCPSSPRPPAPLAREHGAVHGVPLQLVAPLRGHDLEVEVAKE